MSKSILENFEPIQASSPLGLQTDFALTSSKNDDNPFVQVFDMKAPTLFPDLFYLPPPTPKPKPQPIPVKSWKERIDEDKPMRIWLGGMTFVALFLLYRCLVRDELRL